MQIAIKFKASECKQALQLATKFKASEGKKARRPYNF
jgi:hypothetical protein